MAAPTRTPLLSVVNDQGVDSWQAALDALCARRARLLAHLEATDRAIAAMTGSRPRVETESAHAGDERGTAVRRGIARTDEDRRQAVAYADEHGVAAAAGKFGVTAASIYNWRKALGGAPVEALVATEPEGSAEGAAEEEPEPPDADDGATVSAISSAPRRPPLDIERARARAAEAI